jgi:hypothetical protein
VLGYDGPGAGSRHPLRPGHNHTRLADLVGVCGEEAEGYRLASDADAVAPQSRHASGDATRRQGLPSRLDPSLEAWWRSGGDVHASVGSSNLRTAEDAAVDAGLGGLASGERSCLELSW